MGTQDVDRHDPARRAWIAEAIRRVQADANRSADTHLHVVPLPPSWGIELYLKDESVHPTGSLKHRLARSLFLFALANGMLGPDTTVIEASSGSTAVSEAYFARLIGLPFVAVVPRTTSPDKIAAIEAQGGRCHMVERPIDMYDVAAALAADCSGHYMDQFTNAERAMDWRGNHTIAESVFEQMTHERHPIPTWIVVGAGTGGTSATFGRYVRYRQHATRVAVVDPERSAFLPAFETGATDYTTGAPSRIAGIGRPRVEPSFVPEVIDRMLGIPDAASIAAMRHVNRALGRSAGGSTGTNLWGCLHLIAEMRDRGEVGSVVSLICDTAAPYASTYDDDGWVRDQGLDLAPYTTAIEAFLGGGAWSGLDPA